MGCKTIIEQLNEALGKTAVNTTDLLPIAENSTLFRVTVGDLATSLGMTGALTGLNDGGATPVLTGTAPNYVIRGVKGGSGVTVSLSPEGAVNVAADITNAGTTASGAALIPNTSANQLALRRLQAGNGIRLTTETDRIVIENSEVAASNKTQIVSELSDFPTAVSGVITLADDTIYYLVDSVSTANRFIMGNNTILTSNDPFVVSLTYTGTGDMLTLLNGVQGLNNISLRCPNGTLFNSNAVTAGSLLARWLYIPTVKNLGTLKHPSVGLYDWFILNHTGQGFQYGNTVNGRFRSTNLVVQETTSPTAIMLDLQNATFDEFELSSWQMLSTVSGQYLFKGLANQANLSADTIGFVDRCVIKGDMIALNTVSVDEAGWDFTDNNTIPDTEPRAQTYLTTGATTVVNATSTDYVATGVFAESTASVFSTNVNGRVTYLGRRDKYVRVDITASFEPASGTGKSLTIGLSVNGVVQTETKVNRTASAGSAAVVSVDWGFELSTNDFIEVVVSNETDTNDIVINQLLLRAS